MAKNAVSTPHAPVAALPPDAAQRMPVVASIAVVALILGVGGFAAVKNGALGNGSDDSGKPKQTSAELAEISNCAGPYKAALMMQQDSGDLTETDLQRQAHLDCTAMTPAQRAVYSGEVAPKLTSDDKSGDAENGLPEESGSSALGDPSVRLWYPESKAYSEELVYNSDFILWNTVIGEGSAKEPTDAVRFSIPLRKVDFPPKEGLRLIVTDANGKVLASKKFDNFDFGSKKEIEYQIIVNNIGCAGDTNFAAKYGDYAAYTSLDFACGE